MSRTQRFLLPLLVLVLFGLGAFVATTAGSGAPDVEALDAAALDGLQAIGWDVKGFTAEMQATEGDYARVLIRSTDPPGGFTAYVQRQADGWQVIAHGSAFNPAELDALGVPDSLR